MNTLFENNGNTVLEAVATNPNANVYFDGRYAIYDNSSAPVPEPGTLMLIGMGLLGFRLVKRRD